MGICLSIEEEIDDNFQCFYHHDPIQVSVARQIEQREVLSSRLRTNGRCKTAALPDASVTVIQWQEQRGFICFLGLVHAIELAYWLGFLGGAKTCK
jgi:hypothetical protein